MEHETFSIVLEDLEMKNAGFSSEKNEAGLVLGLTTGHFDIDVKVSVTFCLPANGVSKPMT